jgi:hypothetical protein
MRGTIFTVLWTIFILLLTLWLLGVISSFVSGGFMNVLLLSALVALLFQLITSRLSAV